MPAPKTPPSKTDIAELEPFAGLGLESIYVVTNERQAGLALDELMRAAVVGFDWGGARWLTWPVDSLVVGPGLEAWLLGC